MQAVVLVFHLLIVLALIGVVLLQRSEGGGLGMGGGSGGGLVSIRGTANMLSRATGILAAVFFMTSITLAVLASVRDEPGSIFDETPAAATAPPVEQPEPVRPGVPLSQ